MATSHLFIIEIIAVSYYCIGAFSNAGLRGLCPLEDDAQEQYLCVGCAPGVKLDARRSWLPAVAQLLWRGMSVCEADHPWFKRRFYAHFDRPMRCNAAVALATTPARVSTHAFLPFLSFDLGSRRYDRKKRKVTQKVRRVSVAAHADAHIFSYYSWQLREKLERALDKCSISESVLAYRRMNPRKSNIEFADEAFRFILSFGSCEAVGLDIEGFFDGIPHEILKRQWAELLGEKLLPEDHYSVFRAVTKWSSVDRDKAFSALGISKRHAGRMRRAICTPREFRETIRGSNLIDVNRGTKGIPQGSPVSAVLSNIVMIELDRRMSRCAAKHGALYRRYSDDILLVGCADAVGGLEELLRLELERMKLNIQDEKTVRCSFQRDVVSGVLRSSRPLQYLGFIFDGERILIRPQTLSKFQQRMKAGVRSARRAARRAENKGGRRQLFRRDLFTRFSHLGPAGMRFDRTSHTPRRSNFWRYVVRASRNMRRSEIRRQMRRHWPRLNAEIRGADETD